MLRAAVVSCRRGEAGVDAGISGFSAEKPYRKLHHHRIAGQFRWWRWQRAGPPQGGQRFLIQQAVAGDLLDLRIGDPALAVDGKAQPDHALLVRALGLPRIASILLQTAEQQALPVGPLPCRGSGLIGGGSIAVGGAAATAAGAVVCAAGRELCGVTGSMVAIFSGRGGEATASARRELGSGGGVLGRGWL